MNLPDDDLRECGCIVAKIDSAWSCKVVHDKNFPNIKKMPDKNSSHNVCKQYLPDNGILCVCPPAPVDPSDICLSCSKPPSVHVTRS